MKKTIHEMDLGELVAHRKVVLDSLVRESEIYVQKAYRNVLSCIDTLIQRQKAGK